ncbi:unnamed protein product [Clonostachys rhizophaga]|uniref:Xaa-Pro dipeptidyl-peptidase C-terminal domain-containing protein n=1 Tax=Clonostachys rhizophaga TaxID=160324 RepID=A0A9N9VJW6_9HYPO|nr:unnamed protein product [Clonostachys rhizophaga]
MSSYKIGQIDVLHQDNIRPTHGEPRSPSRTILKPGHRRTEKNRPILVETILESDQILTMRDGVTLRADVFRPVTDERVPAIIMYGPYGKSGSGWFNIDKFPFRVGIPESKLSGYENFEGLDPAEWVPKQYAIVNVDARGINDSEGNEVAKLPWCSGKVSMAGNSWLAACQWYTAAQKPPHLACIAPMEGISDPFREHIYRGGILNTRFATPLSASFIGRGQRDDMPAMAAKYPDNNEYWDDKRANMEEIKVPSYIVASYSTGLHTIGSFRGFEEMASKDKWISVHATQEWYDLYSKERTDDLQKFMNRYLKGIENGWEQTPRVRYAFIRFNEDAEVNVPFADLPWNLSSAREQRLFLSADRKLLPTKASEPGQVSYQADAPSKLMGPDPNDPFFSYTFPQQTRLAGPATAILYVSSPSGNDMDVHVQLRKADKNGELLTYANIPLKDIGVSTVSEVPNTNVMKYLGPTGMLRASRRHVSEALSSRSKSWKTLSHSQVEPVEPGDIIRLEIQLWPTGLIFDAGERLLLYVSGHYMTLPEFETMPPYENHNRGHHIIHVGGEYDSSLMFYQV